MRDLILIDKATGHRENVGAIARRRWVGSRFRLILTLDRESWWWIIVSDQVDGGVRKIGFPPSRREDCLQVFANVTQDELTRLSEREEN